MDAHHVVIAQREEWVRELLERGLRDAGFVVTSATRATDGLQKALELSPDCVIADADAGCEILAEELRFYEETSHIPLILIASEDDEAARARALEAGAEALVTRPFLLSEVVAQIRALVRLGTRVQEVRRSMFDAVEGVDGTSFRGELEHMPISSLLALLEFERKTGLVQARHQERHARYELAGGLVTWAELDGQRLDLALVLSETIGWSEGRIAFRAFAAAEPPEGARSVRALLSTARGAGLLSRKSAVSGGKPNPYDRQTVPRMKSGVERAQKPR